MPELTISEVARQVGLQASAIRYYERIGLLPRAPRVSGQRRYDTTALYRLAIIQRARQLGFTLTEIRHLFFGFRDITRPSERWRTLSQRKLEELNHLMDGIKAVRSVLKKLMTKCRCDTLDQCGKGIFHRMKRDGRSLPASRRHRGNIRRVCKRRWEKQILTSRQGLSNMLAAASFTTKTRHFPVGRTNPA